jgi:HlyD family secretion protein
MEQFKHPRRYVAVILSAQALCLALLLLQSGCDTPAYVKKNDATLESVPPGDISAQGRLLPAGGIVQIGALPGDRIEEFFVEVGQTVDAGTVLVRMRSESVRAAELETLNTKLLEAISALEAKKTEASLAVKTARNRHEQAVAAQRQATEQLGLIQSQIDDPEKGQLIGARRQLETLIALRENPLTRPMIGSIELDARKAELSKLETTLQSSKLTAEQAVETTELAVKSTSEAVSAAEKTESLVESASPIESFRKQIDVLEEQIKQSRITAPTKATILSRNGKVGEPGGLLPIIELADLDTMICLAEVHEADVGRVRIGDIAVMTSAALAKKIRGKVSRVDALIGVPQMRSPNPMARTDFRAVPVVIDIDPELSRFAANRVQLQVDLTIAKE